MLPYDTPTSAYREDEIDLRHLVLLIAKWKRSVLVLALVAALTAFLVSSFLMAPEYEATTVVSLPSAPEGLSWSIQSYEAFALSDLVLTRVAHYLGLDLTPSELRSHFSVVLNQNARLLTTKAKASTPQLASGLAEAWGQQFSKAVSEILEGHLEEEKQALRAVLSETKDELRHAEQALLAFDQHHDLAFQSSRLDALRHELRNTEDRLNQLIHSLIPTETARVSALEKACLELVGLFPSSSGPSSSQSQNAEEQDRNTAILTQMNLREQLVYVELREQLALASATLAAYQQEVIALQQRLPELHAEIEKLNQTRVVLEDERDQLTADLKQAQELYGKAWVRYSSLVDRESQLAAATRVTTLKEPATPRTPVSPNILLNVVTAVILAVIAGVVTALLVESWKAASVRQDDKDIST